MAYVVAELVDENTLVVQGDRFIREREEEVFLQPVESGVFGPNPITPDLRCSNCGYQRGYFGWYLLTGFKGRHVKYCPGCGYKIMGTIARDGEE